MGIFNNIKNNTGNTKQTAPIKHRTTKNFFLGYPEAEAEAHNNSQIPFTTLYTNINLIENLDDSRFILVGKKGTGKSAFAKYIESNNIANFFCKTLRKNDLDIDGIVSACGKDFDYESVSRWVLSVQMLKLISNSQSLDHKEQENIKKFLEINSGYVDFDKYSIKAISNQKDIKIDISPLKSILKIIGGEQKKLDQEKPSFLQVLPSLEELLSKILTEEKCRESQNSYLIILDDLDHGFNAKNSTHIANGYSLITAARNFNNEICREGNAKTILLMRDDIIRRIESHEAGSAKAISSYAYKIKWHDNNLKGEAEKFNKLNEFIEKRLKHNFVKNNIQKNNKTSSYLEEFLSISFPFKYLLDRSFHKPRDFLLMFLDIGETPFALPMDKYRLDKILKKYKSEMIKEIKNELIAHLPRSVVDDAITIITRNNKEIGIEYSDFQNYIRKVIPPESELTVDMVIERLYDSSIIGQIKDGRNFFKYRQGEREEEAHLHDFEIGQKILAHNIARL